RAWVHAFNDGSVVRGAPSNFSIHAENKFSVARFHVLRIGQTLPARGGPGGFWALTSISRVTVRHASGAPLRTSEACHVPGAGAATSAIQKYGGPPCRSCDLAATLPSGAISVNSPSSVCSAATRTRSGAPFQGAIGAASTATSASWQLAAAVAARASLRVPTKNAPASSSDATAAANPPDRSIEPPPVNVAGQYLESFG